MQWMLFKSPFESLTVLGSCVQIIHFFKGMQKQNANNFKKCVHQKHVSLYACRHSFGELDSLRQTQCVKILNYMCQTRIFLRGIKRGKFIFPYPIIPNFLMCIYFNCNILYYIFICIQFQYHVLILFFCFSKLGNGKEIKIVLLEMDHLQSELGHASSILNQLLVDNGTIETN